MSRSPPLAESSNPASPSHSIHNADVSLETLVSHLLASKRSLSSINSVWQANEIVTSARNALEESVALNARTAFLRNGIGKQVILLQQVRSGIEGVYEEGQKDFKVIQVLADHECS
jgi:autophagy-related protein 17